MTCEVAPHHFTLDEGACATLRPALQGPPAAARARLTWPRFASPCATGGCDAVASDHAPHAPELKDLAFDEAPAGMLGLEHAASLTFEALGGAEAVAPTVLRAAQSRPGAHRPAARAATAA